MNSLTKLPYKVKFQPQYQQIQERISKLPILPPASSSYQVSDVLFQLFDKSKEKIKQQQLEFSSSNIYSQYASAKQLNDKKKTASEACPGCGQQGKKQVQCQFCAVMYCKNCCWRKRVLPHLSQPKDSRSQCEQCHSKFVKLFANQKFYQQTNILQKIIQTSNTKLKKIEKQAQNKKQRFQGVEKKKKEGKIRENMLLKQIKNQEKKIQDLQAKLQQVVKIKADKLRQEQAKLQQQKRKQQQKEHQQNQKQRLEKQKFQLQMKRQKEEAERIEKQKKLQQQIRENQKKQKQIQAAKQQMRKKQEEVEKELKKQWLELQLQKMKQKQKNKEQERKSLEAQKQLQNQNKQPIKIVYDEKALQHNDKNISITPNKQRNSKSQLNSLTQFQSPINNMLSVNNSFQHLSQPSPLKQNSPAKQSENGTNKSLRTSNTSENFVTTSINAFGNKTQNSQKIEQTEGTQKGAQNLEQDKKIKQNEDNYQSDNVLTAFNVMPQVAINVSQMTVKELLSIHVNPNAMPTPTKRKSQRQSYKEQRPTQFRQSVQQFKNTLTPQQQNQNKISQQQKQNILRSSNISSSLLHSNHSQPEELHQHPDPSGSKCNCAVM